MNFYRRYIHVVLGVLRPQPDKYVPQVPFQHAR